MKRAVIFLFCLSFLPYSLCLGQDYSNDADWECLIDSINSKYVHSYIENRCNNGLEQEYVDLYRNNIEKFFEKGLNRHDLNDALSRYGFDKTIKDVLRPLEKKYSYEGEERTFANAISIDVLDPSIKELLEQTHSELHDDYYPPQTQIEEPKIELVDSMEWAPIIDADGLLVIVLIEAILIILLLIVILLRTSAERMMRRLNREDSLFEYAKTKDLNQISSKVGNVQDKLSELETKVAEISSQSRAVASHPIRDISQNVISQNVVKTSIKKDEVKSDAESQKIESNSKQQEKLNETPKTEPQSTEFAIEYAKNFGDGFLRVCEQEMAQFKLVLSDESNAKFLFCGDVSKAMSNYDGTFDDVIEKDGFTSTAEIIDTTEPGVAVKQSDGKWKVMVPAKLNFR